MKNESDYNNCKKNQSELLTIDRWGNGVQHHPMSKRIMQFISQHDFYEYKDYFCWKYGGDGDNGETLMYQLDAFFEYLDKTEQNKK